MKPLLIIDPGHGGKDPGGGSNQHWLEKDLVLSISLYQFMRFTQLGVQAGLTRDRDVYLSPTERTEKVRDSGALYCISNHINAGGGDGVETIHSIYADHALAKLLAHEIVAEGQNLRRTFSRALPSNEKKDYYFMHRNTGSVNTTIVEYGFADSTRDDVMQLQTDWVDYAEAVVRGFCKFVKHPYEPPAPPAPPVVGPFKDVPADHWAAGSVSRVKAAGIMAGYTDGTFRGEAPVTRYEMAEILDRLLKG
jgi:N-acetylmuramoyl-L-alanine amidase